MNIDEFLNLDEVKKRINPENCFEKSVHSIAEFFCENAPLGMIVSYNMYRESYEMDWIDEQLLKCLFLYMADEFDHVDNSAFFMLGKGDNTLMAIEDNFDKYEYNFMSVLPNFNLTDKNFIIQQARLDFTTGKIDYARPHEFNFDEKTIDHKKVKLDDFRDVLIKTDFKSDKFITEKEGE
jgi:hypothetical protein